MKPRTIFLLPIFLTSPATAEALSCSKLRTESLRELESFVEDRHEIIQACRYNSRAPANNRNATLSGTCERTYKFMNGYVLQVRSLLNLACSKIDADQNFVCQPSQADCLRASATRFHTAAVELEKAESLLQRAQKKMEEQRALNADVGKMYAKNLDRIKRTMEQQKGIRPPPKNSPLNEPSDITGADSAKTEGLKSLREVIKAYDLPEDTKLLGARAQRIERAFSGNTQSVSPEELGPFAGEQFIAFRRAGEFSRLAENLSLDFRRAGKALHQNADQALHSAGILQTNSAPASLSFAPLTPAPQRQDTPRAPRSEQHSRASDLQLGKLTQTANLLASASVNAGASESMKHALQSKLMNNAEVDEKKDVSLAENVTPDSHDPAKIEIHSSPKTALPLSQDDLVVWYEPRDSSSPPNTDAKRSTSNFTPASANIDASFSFSLLSLTPSHPLEKSDDIIPTLDPDEPVSPQSAPGLKPEREYSLRDQLRRQLAAEEIARTSSTFASARDPDAPLGEQDMRYDRRLGGLTPLASFSMDAQETVDAIRDLASAFQKEIEFPAENSPPLFRRVHEAHERFVRKNATERFAGSK